MLGKTPGHPLASTEFSHSSPRVLVVDDMTTNRLLVRAQLQPAGYSITEATNGEEALKFIAGQDFDVVLLDIMMSGMSGVEVCRRIRLSFDRTQLPIIMLTSLKDSGDLVSAMEAGANDYITKPFNEAELFARVKSAAENKRLTDRLDDTESVLFALARMVEAKDETTGDHCDRLAHMARMFGEVLGLHHDELEALRRGGVLHDIGKLGIPDVILLKPGPLDDEEWVIMRQHTTIGERLCGSLRTMRRTTEIIRHHHEKWNGSGYPDGLKGEEVPLLARVFQVVDVYDALSTKRPYKQAFPRAKVVSIMEEETAKGLWDPGLMAEFLNIVRTRDHLLVRPTEAERDKSAIIFDEISATDILAWARKKIQA